MELYLLSATGVFQAQLISPRNAIGRVLDLNSNKLLRFSLIGISTFEWQSMR